MASLPLRFADHVIAPTNYFSEEVNTPHCQRIGAPFSLARPTEMFPRKARTKTKQGAAIVFLGGLRSQHGLDIAIHAFGEVRRNKPDAELHIYAWAPGEMRASLGPLVQSLDLEEGVTFYAITSFAEMGEVIANADIGLVPVLTDVLETEAYITQIMEFMTQGVPVVAPQSGIDGLHCEEGNVHFFPAGDSRAMSKAMLDVIKNRDLHESLVKMGYEYVA